VDGGIVMEQLLSILADIRPDVDFSNEEKLVENGILDSFNIITIASEINNAFDVEINIADLAPENMNSAKALWELIARLKNK